MNFSVHRILLMGSRKISSGHFWNSLAGSNRAEVTNPIPRSIGEIPERIGRNEKREKATFCSVENSQCRLAKNLCCYANMEGNAYLWLRRSEKTRQLPYLKTEVTFYPVYLLANPCSPTKYECIPQRGRMSITLRWATSTDSWMSPRVVDCQL